nr:hypothetical protein [Tanacetum cinerariifolium]
MLIQEYIKKVIEDVGEDEDFKSGSWVRATEYVNVNGGISCTLNVLGDLTMTLKDLSVLGSGIGVGGSGMLDEEEILKLLKE